MLWHENSKLHKSNKAISKQKHPCDICDEPFDKRLEMLQHKLKMKHFKKSKCGTCGSLFKDRDSLRTHHENSYYKCEFCEMNFCDQESLIGHVTDKHSMKDALYKCNTCDKCFGFMKILFLITNYFIFRNLQTCKNYSSEKFVAVLDYLKMCKMFSQCPTKVYKIIINHNKQ